MKRKFASWVKFVYVPVKEIISFLLKMARNVCYHPCGKYSNTKNNRGSTSWNQSGRNVQGSDKEAIFRSQVASNSILPRMLLNEMACWIQILELAKYYIEDPGWFEDGTLVKSHWSIESQQHLSDLVFK